MTNEENYQIEDNIDNSNEQKSLGAMTNSYYIDNSKENSKIFASNNYITRNIDLKDSPNNSYEEKNKNILLESEEIFINLKKEIEKTQEKNKNFIPLKANNWNQGILNEKEGINHINDVKRDNTIIFSLNDNENFEFTTFDNNESNEERPKIPVFNEQWKSLSFLLSDSKNNLHENTTNFVELNKIALRSLKEIDYSLMGLELKIKFNLHGESELWIFTRTSVDKNINKSFYSDVNNEKQDENENFNKYSSVIKIVKERNSNKCFVDFGTFYQEINDNNKLYYKSFLKRQLIDNSEIERDYDYYYLNENDKCEFEIFVTDYGEERINTKIYLNNDKKFNDINGRFFLPINIKGKFLVCGIGRSVQIKELVAKIQDKEKLKMKSIIQFEADNEIPKNCECCNIF